MTQDDYARKMDELDSLLNDPNVPMDPARVWSLLADLSSRSAAVPAQGGFGPDARGAARQDGVSAD